MAIVTKRCGRVVTIAAIGQYHLFVGVEQTALRLVPMCAAASMVLSCI
jgi:hypothetical protein